VSTRLPDAPQRHRFFRAMVLMGGSLAVGCGGTATAGSADPGGGGGDGGSGGPGGSGGSGSGGAGGSGGPGGSGGFVIDAGVGTGGSVARDGGPMPCVPAQWDCSSASPSCSFDPMGYELPQGCACDGTRPRSEAECAANESFTCLKAAYVAGEPLTNPVSFECSCVPSQESCDLMCREAFDNGATYPTCELGVDEPPSTVLCGCAVVVLR